MINLKIVLSLMTLFFVTTSHGFTNTLETDDTARRVIDYFHQNDIDVVVYPPAFPAVIGEMGFYQKLNKMWKVLDRDKVTIVRRVEGMSKIILSTYTTANFDQETLTLDVNHDSETLNRYWPLMAKKNDLYRTLSVELRTNTIDMHSVGEDDFASFTELVEFFLSRRKQINNLAGIIREINVGASEYLLLPYGSMSLRQDNIEEGFDRYGDMLKRAGALFRPHSKTPTEIRLGYDLDRPEQKEEFDRMIDSLEVEREYVLRLMTSDRIRRIDIGFGREENSFDRRQGEVRLASRGSGIETMAIQLPAIVRELDLTDEIGVSITTTVDRIDENYINGITKVERFKDEIREKAERMTEIRLTTYQNTRFALGSLYINPREDDQFLADVLKGIEL